MQIKTSFWFLISSSLSSSCSDPEQQPALVAHGRVFWPPLRDLRGSGVEQAGVEPPGRVDVRVSVRSPWDETLTSLLTLRDEEVMVDDGLWRSEASAREAGEDAGFFMLFSLRVFVETRGASHVADVLRSGLWVDWMLRWSGWWEIYSSADGRCRRVHVRRTRRVKLL